MSLLSSFITNQLLAAIEHEFTNNQAEIQAAIFSELQNFVGQCTSWLESKVDLIPMVDKSPAEDVPGASNSIDESKLL